MSQRKNKSLYDNESSDSGNFPSSVSKSLGISSFKVVNLHITSYLTTLVQCHTLDKCILHKPPERL